MISLSPEIVVLVMFGGALIGILLGYPLAAVLAGLAAIVGILALGPRVSGVLGGKVVGVIQTYEFLALPLFVFMGEMVERAGLADRMFEALYSCLGGLRGGLAIATIVLSILVAACVGVVAASVTLVGLIAMPSMLSRGYDKKLVCGSVCAGGSLGILIPPSVMLVVYGPNASLSVGRLFMAAIVPGLLLGALYIGYIVVLCAIWPNKGPSVPRSERSQRSALGKLYLLLTSVVPLAILILSVLGVIFFGLAAPTEAAAAGAAMAVLLAAVHRKLHLELLGDVVVRTMRITCMAMFIAFGAAMFTGVFLRLGGGDVIGSLLLAAPFGRWGVLAAIILVVFIMGMFLDWLGIVFVMIPLISPIGETLGFDPLWFAMLVIICLQFSFLTPPFAYAIFYVKAITRPEWQISTADIVSGVIPFIGLIAVALVLVMVFPELVLWLPHLMIG